VDDSLFAKANMDDKLDLLEYLKRYQKDNSERVQLLCQKWIETSGADEVFAYEFYDVALDIEKWNNNPEALKTYKNLAARVYNTNSDELMKDYFECKFWSLAHKQDYQGILLRNLAFKSKFSDKVFLWVRRNNYSLLSYAHAGIGNYDSSILYAQSGLTCMEEGDDFYRANLMKQVAYVATIIGDDSLAYKSLNKAIVISESFGFKKTLAHLYLMAGRLQLKNEEVTKSIHLFKKSMALEKETLGYKYSSVSSINLGIAYKQLEQQDSALFYLDEAKKYDKDNKYIGEILLNEINIFIQRGEWSEARERLLKCIEIAGDKNKTLTAVSYQNLAFITFKQKNYNESIRLSYMAEALFLSTTESKRNLIDLYSTLEESYKALGQYKSAYEVLEKENKIEDQLNVESSEKARVSYEVKQKTRDIVAKHERGLLELKNSNQKLIYRNWLIAALALAILLSFIAIYLYVKRKKIQHLFEIEQANVELAYQDRRFQEIEQDLERNVKSEISEELHDNILSALSGIRLLSESMQMTIAETRNEELIITHQKEHAALKQVYHELRTYVDDLKLNSHTRVHSNIILDLADFIKSFLKPTEIEVTVDSELGETLSRLPDNIQVALVRVVKEILTNIIKHSKAKKCFVKVRWDQNVFSVSIFDDGVGFDDEDVERKSGIANIEKRVVNADGTFVILSKEGGGTLIDMEFPLA
jgi:signal transduction histidine kinase